MIKISRKQLSELEDAAKQASQHAYAPYSSLSVGAALLAEDGEMYVGCNVENASYGLTNCAERTAVFCAVADGRGRGDFAALMLYVPGDVCHSPCGACRQVLSEFLAPEAFIYSTCDTGEVVAWSMEELLPDAFELSAGESQ